MRCTNYSSHNSGSVNGLDGCKEMCNNDDNCNAFAFNSSENMCVTYANCTIDDFFEQSWGYNFYEKKNIPVVMIKRQKKMHVKQQITHILMATMQVVKKKKRKKMLVNK